MSIRERIATYRDVVKQAGAKDVRMALNTSEAVELVQELAASELRNPDKAKAAGAAFAEMAKAEVGEGEEAVMQRAAALNDLAVKFWAEFEGETVDGVDIIRRRA